MRLDIKIQTWIKRWRGEAGLTQRAPVFASAPHWGSSGGPKALRGVGRVQEAQGGRGQRQGILLTLTETEQALYALLTSRPLTLGPLMDTSGWSLRLKSVFCRLSASLGGPRLDRCKQFSERTGNFHHLSPS